VLNVLALEEQNLQSPSKIKVTPKSTI
jgi:hypothetical protein